LTGETVLVELGAVIVGLAILSRIAGTLGLPTIPLYLAAGLAFGEGGIVPIVTTEDFIGVGAEIGLILLLFMLGLKYSAAELISTVRTQAPAGVIDILLNFTPGFLGGLILGWSVVPAIVLGGVTYLTSSGIVSKLLSDMGRIGNRETPSIISLIVIEDLAMAAYLPVIGVLLTGEGSASAIVPALIAVAAVAGVLALALRVEVGLSRVIFSHSDEALLLSILGLTLLIAGVAEAFQVSAAVAALIVGIVLSGPAAEGAQELLAPLRDLFAAIFFAFVGLSLDPGEITPVLGSATALAVVGMITKFITGWLGARFMGVGPKGRARAGLTLIARGEFSIAIAGFATAAGVNPELEALAVSYVFLLAVAGPVLVRIGEPVSNWLLTRSRRTEPL
jgi:CPA2 family monovalent cation:H+ antiporter-2